MPTKRICILDCDYVLENTVHKFPNAKTDPERRKKWLELVGVQEEPAVKYIYLCSNHFSRLQYHGTLLNRNALPDINLHKCTFGSEQDIKKPKEHLDMTADSEDNDDKQIKTIKVDMELYNRIVKAGFMDLGDENSLSKRRQLNTKACQTETSTGYTCSIIEYNFKTNSYLIHCFFCDQIFHLSDFIMYEQHMILEHKNIRECYNQYTIMDKRKLFEIKKRVPPGGGLSLLPNAWSYLKEKLSSNAAVRDAIKNNIICVDNHADYASTNGNSTKDDSMSDGESTGGRDSVTMEKESESDIQFKTTESATDVITTQYISEIFNAKDGEDKNKFKKELALINRLTKSSRPTRRNNHKFSLITRDREDPALLDTVETLAQNLIKNIVTSKDSSIGTDTNDLNSNPTETTKSEIKAVLHEDDNFKSLTLTGDLEQNAVFYKNLQISSHENPLCCSDVYTSEDDCDNSIVQKTDNEIRFSTTPPEVVNHFLDLMKNNTVLCFNRTRCPEKYDLAISNIIIELRLAHKLTLSSLEIRRSINRIKNWFNKILKKLEDPKCDRFLHYVPPYPAKYDEYFKKCVEFLPRYNTSNHWFTTQSIFTTDDFDRKGVKMGYECEFCKIYFQTPVLYNEHMAIEHRKCKVCNLVCRDEKNFATHLKTHLTTGMSRRPVYECPDCKRSFPLRNMLKTHMTRFCTKVPLGENLTTVKDGKTIKLYPCRMCEQTFEASHMRRWHELKHDTPQYKCDLCPKAFYTKFPLEQHYRSHQNLRDFICDVCGKGYCSYKNLYCHQQTVHFRKKKYVCDICGIDVTNNCNLARHKRVVHSQLEKGTYIEYKCKRKGKEYLCRKRVRENRSKPQKYKCKLCCIFFGKYKELLEHKREHHSENKAVKCKICDKRVGQTYMKRHMRQTHKITEIELENGSSMDTTKEIEANIQDGLEDEDNFIIENYDSENEPYQPDDLENDMNEYEDFIEDEATEEVIKAANDAENENNLIPQKVVTEEDLAYMVFDECS